MTSRFGIDVDRSSGQRTYSLVTPFSDLLDRILHFERLLDTQPVGRVAHCRWTREGDFFMVESVLRGRREEVCHPGVLVNGVE